MTTVAQMASERAGEQKYFRETVLRVTVDIFLADKDCPYRTVFICKKKGLRNRGYTRVVIRYDHPNNAKRFLVNNV